MKLIAIKSSYNNNCEQSKMSYNHNQLNHNQINNDNKFLFFIEYLHIYYSTNTMLMILIDLNNQFNFIDEKYDFP